MKTLLSVFLLFIGGILFAQQEPYGYITTQPITVYGYNMVTGVSVPGTVLVANSNLRFRQIGDVRTDTNLGDVYVIQFWKITNEPAYITASTTMINSGNTQNTFYCVKKDVYKEPAIRKRYKTWGYNFRPSIGTLVVPIKMRPSIGSMPFDFSTDFTLGSSFGISARMSHYQPNYLSLVGVFGVTSVGVDSASTGGFYGNAKFAAITPGIGVIFDITGFQIGGVVGWDIIGGQTGKRWIYNGKTWFSFGIGYQFLRKKED